METEESNSSFCLAALIMLDMTLRRSQSAKIKFYLEQSNKQKKNYGVGSSFYEKFL